MNQLIKGSTRSVSMFALLIFGVVLFVGCGTKPAETQAEAAPAPAVEAQPAEAPVTGLTADSSGPSLDSQPANPVAMPEYNSSMPAKLPLQQAVDANDEEAEPTEALLEPVTLDSTQADVFVEHAAIDALSEELFLEIINPDEDVAFVESPTFVLIARTILDAAVSVNDDLVDVNEEGILETILTLEEGPNLVEVVTSVATGEEKSTVLTIFYLP